MRLAGRILLVLAPPWPIYDGIALLIAERVYAALGA
jgi:hypothetical protein